MNQPHRDRDLVYVSGPDWWSRIVAIGSLAVAGSALYWGYLRDQKAGMQNGDPTAEVKSVVADGIQSIRDEAIQEQRRLDDHVATAIQEIDRRAQQVADTRSSASPSPSLGSFEEPISSHPNTADRLQLADDTPAPVTSIARPELIEVFAVLRVDDLADRPTLIVRNRGQAAARVTHVRFEPSMDFDQVPAELADRDFGDTTSDRLLVRFLPADNLAANPQVHGTYQRALDQPFDVAIDQDIYLQVVIANPTHRRFGLRGRLTLLADGVEIANFENIAVPFVAN